MHLLNALLTLCIYWLRPPVRLKTAQILHVMDFTRFSKQSFEICVDGDMIALHNCQFLFLNTVSVIPCMQEMAPQQASKHAIITVPTLVARQCPKAGNQYRCTWFWAINSPSNGRLCVDIISVPPIREAACYFNVYLMLGKSLLFFRDNSLALYIFCISWESIVTTYFTLFS